MNLKKIYKNCRPEGKILSHPLYDNVNMILDSVIKIKVTLKFFNANPHFLLEIFM